MNLILTDDEKKIIPVSEKINEQSKLIKLIQFVGHNHPLATFIGLIIGLGCVIIFLGGSDWKIFQLAGLSIIFIVSGLIEICKTYCDWIVIKKLSFKIKSRKKTAFSF